LTHDALSGQYFQSSVNKIEAAVNKVNAELAQDGNVCLNDLYDYLNLDPIALGDQIGWSGEMIRAEIGATRTSDGQAVNSVTFQPIPKAGYTKR
jgi:biotin operon repressor